MTEFIYLKQKNPKNSSSTYKVDIKKTKSVCVWILATHNEVHHYRCTYLRSIYLMK